MIEILRSRDDLQKVQDRFASTLGAVPHDTVRTKIKFRGGPYLTEVWWLPTLGIWAHFGLPPRQKPNRNRFWNVFGVGIPGNSVRIVCEVNSPLAGLDARVAGAFARDDTGRYLILHSGKFTGGGLDQPTFLARYKGPKATVRRGESPQVFAIVMEPHSASAALQLRDFVLDVSRLKGFA